MLQKWPLYSSKTETNLLKETQQNHTLKPIKIIKVLKRLLTLYEYEFGVQMHANFLFNFTPKYTKTFL